MRYRLPNSNVLGNLKRRQHKVFNYGNRILLAGCFCQQGGPDSFNAVCERLDENRTCEGTSGLYAACDSALDDAGHALALTIQQA